MNLQKPKSHKIAQFRNKTNRTATIIGIHVKRRGHAPTSASGHPSGPSRRRHSFRFSHWLGHRQKRRDAASPRWRPRRSAALPVRRQDGGVPSQRRLPDSIGAAPIAGNHSKCKRKHHIKTKTMLIVLYFDIQARMVVAFCRFSVTLFVTENRQIVQANSLFK